MASIDIIQIAIFMEDMYMERKIVKTCDFSAEMAATILTWLNMNEVWLKKVGTYLEIITDKSPLDLKYPEGWYYGDGGFTNKHESTTGAYSWVLMKTTKGTDWVDLVSTCNR